MFQRKCACFSKPCAQVGIFSFLIYAVAQLIEFEYGTWNIFIVTQNRFSVQTYFFPVFQRVSKFDILIKGHIRFTQDSAVFIAQQSIFFFPDKITTVLRRNKTGGI